MNKTFLILLLICAPSISFAQNNQNPKPQIDSVWICGNKNTVKYHTDENCRGLANCQVNPTKRIKSDAIKTNQPCKICSKSDL